MPPVCHTPFFRPPFVLTLLSLAMSQTWAQTVPQPAAPPASTLEAVIVTGRALSAKKAIAEKRAERVVSDGVSSDEIGAIPDFGLGEALERVSGVSMIVNNGRGEAQFMTIRGFNPDYNAVTIDGIALPGTETTRRIVSLDVIPSSLAKQISVYKSFTPEMDGNAIGGLTNLRTRSAFDTAGPQLTLRGDLSHWTSEPRLRGKSPSGEIEATASNTFGADNQFGALISGSYFSRTSSSLNTAIDSYSYFAKPGTQPNSAKLNPASQDVSNALPFPDRLRWLTYDNVRTRSSLFTKLDFDEGRAIRAHLTGGYFQHVNDEHRHSHWLQNNTAATSQVTIGDGVGSAASGQSQADYAKFKQTRELKFLEAGVQGEPWERGVVDFIVNSARGSYRQDALIYTFAQANSNGLAYDYTQASGDVPVLIPRNNAQLFDASRYTLGGTNGPQTEVSSTRQTTVKLDLAHNLDDAARGWGFKSGLQLRDADKRYDYDESLFVPATGQTARLSEAGVNPAVYVPYTSLAGRPMLLIDQDATSAFVAANPGRFAPAGSNAANSTQRDFRVKERVEAAYAMTAYQAASLNATLGARIERTNIDIDTFLPSPLNQSAVFVPYRLSSSRTDVLPSINVNWDALADVRLRAAASQSVARPQYSQLAQNSNSVAGTNITTTLANPTLKPRQALNLDLSAEWYVSPNQALTLGLFDKRISDEIANTTATTSAVIGGQTFTQNTTQATNVGTAKVSGLELGYTNVRFTSLPAPFNGFGVSANLTLMRQNPASVRMADGSLRQLPGLQDSAKRLFNFSLLWGEGPWSGQLAYKLTGKTLITASSNSAAQDVFVEAVGIVDAQLRYQLAKQLSVIAQAKNLTNEPQQRRLTGPSASLLNQEINNGKSYWLGVTYAY